MSAFLNQLRLLCALGPALALEGAVFDIGVSTMIPDNSGSGVVSSMVLSADQVFGPVAAVRVRLSVSGVGVGGAFNGDLYAALRHVNGFTVLLNRPGKSADNTWGYGDNGLEVVLDDSAGLPDIHDYQSSLGGPPAGPLAGAWSTDGRMTDPAVVTGTSPRNTALDIFVGMEASGLWTLFVADLSGGGQARLDSWGLDLEVTPVPEPAAAALVLLLGAGVWCGAGRKR